MRMDVMHACQSAHEHTSMYTSHTPACLMVPRADCERVFLCSLTVVQALLQAAGQPHVQSSALLASGHWL